LPPGVHAVREAPGYVLCELSLDDDALAALAERDAAIRDVAEREEAVRERLSDAVADFAAACEDAMAALGTLDCALSRVAFVQRYGGCVPEFVADAQIAFEDARYLPLATSLAQVGRPYVPISLALSGSATVTGPNMGGKSAALRTCGFVAECVARGVPVPAVSARVGLFDEIVWLGTESAQGALLSAFGREVVELRAFMDRATSRALVLIDEFARTTSPREGRALLAALLVRLRELGACTLAATHLPGVAAAAGATHYAIVGLRSLPAPDDGAPDLATALSRIGAAMDYRLERVGEDDGAPTDAIALAALLGLDAKLIARAKEELGKA
jgi:DNA mismatch repair protein MutS2